MRLYQTFLQLISRVNIHTLLELISLASTAITTHFSQRRSRRELRPKLSLTDKYEIYLSAKSENTSNGLIHLAPTAIIVHLSQKTHAKALPLDSFLKNKYNSHELTH